MELAPGTFGIREINEAFRLFSNKPLAGQGVLQCGK
jgi:hypothetical protein